MHTLKKTAAAVAIALAAGAADAAITDGLFEPSELFVNVWDETAQQSYAMDLGITTAQFLTNPSQSLSFNLASDSNYASFLSPQSPLVFNVAGFDSVLNALSDVPDFGALVTTNEDVNANSTFNNVWDVSTVVATGTRISVHIGGLNALESNPNANGAGNGSGVSTPGDGDAYYGTNTWLNNMGGGLPFIDSAGVDTALNFWHLGTTDGSDAIATMLAGSWTLSSTGMLTYAATSQVPVPAAVWLFGSGLVGLIGVARRKQAERVQA